MVPCTRLARRTLCVVLPSFALFALACSDQDTVDSAAGGAGGATGSHAAGSASISGAAGSSALAGGSNSSGAGGVPDSAAGDAGSAGDAGGVSSPDDLAPTVVSTFPVDGATHVSSHDSVSALFSEAMAATTLRAESFNVMHGSDVIHGTVSAFNDSVTFWPDVPFALNTSYEATITVAATDLAGNPLALAYSWSFETDAALAHGPAPVLLGAAGNYVILAKSEVSNVPTSAITGNLGLSPAAASYITGFPMKKAGNRWTSPQVVGALFAADNDVPTPANLTTAVANMQTAYTDAAGRPTPDFTNLGSGTIGGMTLAPGLYKWASSVTIPTNITLSGAANDVWIFQITGDLKMSAAKAMTLIGGAQAKNIFWQVAGLVDLGTTAHAEGIVLSKTAIKLGTGATINGRLLAQTAVTLASNRVTQPTP